MKFRVCGINEKKARKGLFFRLERVMGIEPTLFAWEAKVLPLNYTRIIQLLSVDDFDSLNM